MRKRKIQKEFVDEGLGFPVRLLNVPMVQVRDTWTPDIDYNALTVGVLRALCFKPARLAGSEVRFIRLHHEMTLQQFASQFGVRHQAVMKWERTGQGSTNMQWSTEKDIRLWLFLQLHGARSHEGFVAIYQALSEQIPNARGPLADTTAFAWRGRRMLAQAR